MLNQLVEQCFLMKFSESEAKILTNATQDYDTSKTRSKSATAKMFIKQILKERADKREATIGIKELEQELLTRFSCKTRPNFQIGDGPGAMKLVAVGKTKEDGVLYKIPSSIDEADWYAGVRKYSSPSYYGREEFIQMFSASVQRGDVEFMKAYLNDAKNFSSYSWANQCSQRSLFFQTKRSSPSMKKLERAKTLPKKTTLNSNSITEYPVM